jgi:hypothetical protein
VSKKWFTASSRFCMRRASALALSLAPVVLLHFLHAGRKFSSSLPPPWKTGVMWSAVSAGLPHR